MREFHLETVSGRRYNSCGPNIRLSRRLALNGTVLNGSKPINRICKISMRHDLAYRDANSGRVTRPKADAVKLRDLNELDDELAVRQNDG